MVSTRYDSPGQVHHRIYTFPVENKIGEHIGEVRITITVGKTPPIVALAIEGLKRSKDSGYIFRMSDHGHLTMPAILTSIHENDHVTIEVKYMVNFPDVTPSSGILSHIRGFFARLFLRD